MRPKNRDGEPIDPVPFLVVALLLATAFISFGPLYLMEFGVSLELAVALSVCLALLGAGISYHQFVWTSNPLVREEVPAATRYLRLLYAIAALVIIVLALRAILELA